MLCYIFHQIDIWNNVGSWLELTSEQKFGNEDWIDWKTMRNTFVAYSENTQSSKIRDIVKLKAEVVGNINNFMPEIKLSNWFIQLHYTTISFS
jgi:hypothetical protein